MTTIAYKHESNEIAWDSRSCSNGVIVTDNAMKLRVRDGIKFWFSGCTADQDSFMNMYFGEKCGEFVPDCDAIVLDGKLLRCGVSKDGEFWREPIESNYAMGSGEKFALAAMDFDLSAREAVEYTKTRCCYTGGEVHSEKL